MARYILDIPDKTIAHIRADYGHGVKWINEEDRKILVESIYNAKPIVNGEWIMKQGIYGVSYCNKCDFELKIDDTNFCPNCGARMKEGDSE